MPERCAATLEIKKFAHRKKKKKSLISSGKPKDNVPLPLHKVEGGGGMTPLDPPPPRTRPWFLRKVQ